MADQVDRLAERWAHHYAGVSTGPWQIWGRIVRLNDLFVEALSRALRVHGIGYKEFQTLGALVLAGPPHEANPGELASLTLLTSGGTTSLLTRMEEKGLITRRSHPCDARGVIVKLTEAGADTFREAIVDVNRVEHQFLIGLSGKERERVVQLLRNLLEGVEQPVAERPSKRLSRLSKI
jgi:DNA-binding MarR family transcriptional regulator